MTVLSLSGLSKHFGPLQALNSVAFDLEPGEVHCLAGENGCGKSTLIKIVTGVYQPDPGATITLMGQTGDRVTPAQARAAGVAVIWQDLALFPDLSVAENIGFDSFTATPLAPPRKRALEANAVAAMERLGVRINPTARLGDLSIAQRQLVAIARVLAADARIVFMDEPTASLTRAETAHLLAAVRNMQAEGIAVVFVSHRLAEVLDIADRVTVIRDGAVVGTYPADGMTQRRLGELMTGQDITPALRPAAVFSKPVLELRSLSREGEYQDISLTLHQGEILGLTGLLGSGRTELALSVFGMTRPDSGEIYLDGKPVRFTSNRQAIAAGIAYVSEDRLNLGLIQPRSIRDNAAMAVSERLDPSGLWLDPRKITRLAQDWVSRLKTKASDVFLPVSTLSGGNQQRVVLGKWLATDPRVLILDAPTVGVDIGARAGIFRVVSELAAQGMAILMISDEASEVHENCDRVLVMREGRIIARHIPQQASEAALEEAING